MPRIKRVQSIFINTPALTIPPSIESINGVVPFTIVLDWLVQLFVFNGTLFFETIEEKFDKALNILLTYIKSMIN